MPEIKPELQTRNEPAIEPDQPSNIQAAIHYLQNDAEPAVAYQQGNNHTYEIATYIEGVSAYPKQSASN